ncbi:MAG: hypothetical protein QW761_00235 [Candidatus Aenigmatarchaeota archaeon]
MPEIFLAIKASDEASPALAEAAKNAELFRDRVVELARQVEQGGEAGRKANAEMRELSRQLNADEKASRLLVDAWEDEHRVGLQTLDVMKGVSSMAGRLTNMYTQYNVAQVRVNQLEEQRTQAMRRLQSAQEALAAAQANLTSVVAQYGPESRQAAEAARAVEKAQKDLAKAQEDATSVEEKLAAAKQQNLMLLGGFILQAPAFISQAISMGQNIMVLANTISQAGGIVSVFQGGIEAVRGAMNFLAANPIMLVIAGIAALVAGLVYAYENCEPFRNAVNALAETLASIFGPAVQAIIDTLTWLWQNVIVPLAEVVGGALLAAWNTLSAGLKWFMDNILMPIYNALKAIYDWITSVIGGLRNMASEAEKTNTKLTELSGTKVTTMGYVPVELIPGAQSGGAVRRTGLALVHGGEHIVPAEIARGSVGGREVVIQKIEVNVEGVLDRDMLKQISEGIGRELKRRGVLT